jgi:hypothetical protein
MAIKGDEVAGVRRWNDILSLGKNLLWLGGMVLGGLILLINFYLQPLVAGQHALKAGQDSVASQVQQYMFRRAMSDSLIAVSLNILANESRESHTRLDTVEKKIADLSRR